MFIYKILFGDDGLFLERYFPAARHIEIQVLELSYQNIAITDASSGVRQRAWGCCAYGRARM